MIRKAIQSCVPAPSALLREENTDVDRRANRIIRFRASIAYLPYQVSHVVRTVRLNHTIRRTCKCIFARHHLPMDIFSYIDEYLFELDFSHKRLPNRGFSRAVHHLIRLERVADVEQALAVGKHFDSLRIGLMVENREALLREFRADLWPFMHHHMMYQWSPRPELWYLIDSFAIGYI